MLHVYVIIGKKLILIAETKYIADAKSVLKNWSVGYISDNGEIIVKKNWDAIVKLNDRKPHSQE